MCCRFALSKPPHAVAEALPQIAGKAILSHFRPRYNIAPTQPVLAVRSAQAAGGRAEFTFLSWGLVPHWAKDASLANSLFNARAESAAHKPSFKGPLRHHRCLIPADGFYEWTRSTQWAGSAQADAGDSIVGIGGSIAPSAYGSGKEIRGDKIYRSGNGNSDSRALNSRNPNGTKRSAATTPLLFTRSNGEGFCFAALWEHWGSPDGSEIESCTLLTVAANADIRPYHPRMPLTIAADDYTRWLNPAIQTPEAIADLLIPPPPGQWTARAVGQAVNNARNDTPECFEPPPPPRQRELF